MMGPSDESLGYSLPPYGLAAKAHSTRSSEEPRSSLPIPEFLSSKSSIPLRFFQNPGLLEIISGSI
jgi:hypothetical protein